MHRHTTECTLKIYTPHTHTNTQNNTQVVEFVDFEERLSCSYVRAASAVEAALLDLHNTLTDSQHNNYQHITGQQKSGQHTTPPNTKQHKKPRMPTAFVNACVAAAHATETALSHAPCYERCSFSEDWSTRPCWLAPTSAGAHMALMDWWATWGVCGGGGGGNGGGEGEGGEGPCGTPLGTCDCWCDDHVVQ